MKKFNMYVTCIKCGLGGNHEVKYQDELCQEFHKCDEHILRTCNRCGYQWNEAPLNLGDDYDKH